MLETIKLTQTLEAERLFEEALDQMRRSHLVDATHLLREALELEPRDARMLGAYGLCMAQRGLAFQKAIACCQRALHYKQNDIELIVNLGRVYKLSGDTGSAYRVFLRGLRLDRKHPLPAAELTRMGVRHPPVLGFLDRAHWLNRSLGRFRKDLKRLGADESK